MIIWLIYLFQLVLFLLRGEKVEAKTRVFFLKNNLGVWASLRAPRLLTNSIELVLPPPIGTKYMDKWEEIT